MKYPQLVPTRAVNAISDWLVSRLEQLGVDSPHIYTRLLLSLLQSTVQMNDPNECNNLETFFNNRKGHNNKRYLEFDADTLKKLNAIQCLQDIVSAEQDISNIEDLVDELCEKLNDIEKKSLDLKEGDHLHLLDECSTAASKNNCCGEEGPQVDSSSKKFLVNIQNHQQKDKEENKLRNKIDFNKRFEEISDSGGGAGAASCAATVDSDPKKRYFRAFPALSKEMEDSFFIWRRNAKSLTWPVDRNKVLLLNSESAGGHSMTSDKTNQNPSQLFGLSDGKPASAVDNTNGLNYIGSCHNNSSGANALSVVNGGGRRKTKRRRNQALSKGKPMETSRKNWNCFFNNNAGYFGNASSNNKASHHHQHHQQYHHHHQHHYDQHRNSSPICWDTQFEGCWEMGPDLIKDFIAKQNKDKKKRCRSKSESGANLSFAEENRKTSDKDGGSIGEDFIKTCSEKAFSLPMMPPIDISFCCGEDYAEALTSLPEFGSNVSLSNDESQTQRLYQRDSHMNEKISENKLKITEGGGSAVDQNDFEKFKAKFNSRVEALWKTSDVVEEEVDSSNYQNSLKIIGNKKTLIPSSSSNVAPSVAPFKEDLRNFWTNYFSSQQNCEKKYKLAVGEECSSLSLSANSFANDLTNTSGYFSMPNTMEDYDRSTGNSGNFLFENSIWSNNLFNSSEETDESFYFKIWNTKNKNDAASQGNKKISEHLMDGGHYKDSLYSLPSYNTSLKWSEGINAGPYASSQYNQTFRMLIENQKSSLETTDYTDSSTNVSSEWHTPTVGNHFNIIQPNMQTWPLSNGVQTISDLYRSEGGGGDVTDSTTFTNGRQNESRVSSVSLANHCSSTSGFVEYSKVKAVIKPFVQEVNLQRQRYAAVLMLRPREVFPEDENLLTSQRTHFNPINSFIDGHSFEISSALDTIEFDRSPSGGLYIDDDKYLEYLRNDIIVGEEDAVIGILGPAALNSFGTPLYASSNCEAAFEHKKALANKRDNFIVRFAVRNCEVACQTDNDLLTNKTFLTEFEEAHKGLAPHDQQQQQQSLFMVFPNDSKTNINNFGKEVWTLNEKNLSNLNAYRDRENDSWDFNNIIRNNNNNSNSHHQINQTDHEDEIDGCFNLERQWSMSEISKQCFLKGHKMINNISSGNNNNNNNNNDNNNSIDSSDANHLLWEMCAACNKDYKSLPANRMLHDEWKLDADEIMNNLNNMQGLYIADDDSLTDCSSYPSRNPQIQIPIAEKYSHHHEGFLNQNVSLEYHEKSLEAQEVIQRVNRLIVDLLRPDIQDYASANPSSEEKSLWLASGNVNPSLKEQNIWQENQNSEILKPFELLKHFTTTEGEDKNNGSLSKEQQWEHSYLADLWRTTTPNLEKEIFNPDNSPSSPTNFSSFDSSAQFQNKNQNQNLNINSPTKFKETQCHHLPPIEPEKNTNNDSINSSNALKRFQQFFNSNLSSNSSSGPKFKFGNRKRRHSAASQNYFYQQCLPVAGKSSLQPSRESSWLKNNNNNIDIADLNAFELKLHDLSTKAFQGNLNKDTDEEASSFEFCKPKQTIITCKYWTTLDPEQAFDSETGEKFKNLNPSEEFDLEEERNPKFSCLVDKNAKILKHMSMIARPLTR